MAAPFTVFSSLSPSDRPTTPFSVLLPSPSLRRSSFPKQKFTSSSSRPGSSAIFPDGLRRPISGRFLAARCQLRSHSPLVPPNDHWSTWSALLAIATFGLWSETTKVGSMVSAALVTILVGLAASNLGIVPYEAPAYSIVFEFLLPLAVPLLLLRANLFKLVHSTGKLFLAFLLGSVATVVGTTMAYLLVPMRSLGQDSWKIASALMGSYVGGTVNYIAISEYLGISSSIMAAGVAADNVVCAMYFMVLFALASRAPSPKASESAYTDLSEECPARSQLTVVQTVTALAVAFAICKCATFLTRLFGTRGGLLPGVTGIAVLLATAFPSLFASLAPSWEIISLVLMQIFFAVIGASGNIWNVINTAPSIFLFAFIQVTVHLLFILGLGRLFGIDLRLILLASNANIGGPTTACGMATAQGWESLVVPGILVGIFGISIATFLGIGFGVSVLKYM